MFVKSKFYQSLLSGVSPYTLHAEGDEGGGEGGGTPAPAAGEAAPNWEKFVSGLEALNGSDGLGGKLDTLINEVRDSRPAPAAPAAQPAADLDGMTRQEFAAHIGSSMLTAVKSMFDEQLSPIVNHVNALSTNFTTKSVHEEAEGLRDKHKDFNEWKDSMLSLATDHPTLGVTDLYHLSRAKNPARASELDKKYAPPSEPRPQRFGGLFGNGATGGPNGNTAPPKITGREAVEAAFREVSERHPVLRDLERTN